MGFVMIRKATEEDCERMDAAARRFATRHPEVKELGYDERDFGPVRVITDYVGALGRPGALGNDAENAKRLGRLWQRVARRALREPRADGIAWGNVGYWVEI